MKVYCLVELVLFVSLKVIIVLIGNIEVGKVNVVIKLKFFDVLGFFGIVILFFIFLLFIVIFI